MPLKTTDFNWDVQINFSKNKSEVVELYKNIDILEDANTAGLSTTRNVFIKGEPYGVLYSKKILRDSLNRVVINKLTGLPLLDPQEGIIGDPNPDWLMGIRNEFSYKNISLSFLIDIRKGGDIFNGTAGVMKSVGTHTDTYNRDETVVFDGVFEDGTPNTIPVKWSSYYRAYSRPFIQELNIEDGSWLRLKELGITYSVGKDQLGSLPIEGISLGILGRNLLLLTDYSGVDPDTNLSGASNSVGRDYFNNPGTRSVLFNVKLIF